jgi:hypothetical protein
VIYRPGRSSPPAIFHDDLKVRIFIYRSSYKNTVFGGRVEGDVSDILATQYFRHFNRSLPRNRLT